MMGVVAVVSLAMNLAKSLLRQVSRYAIWSAILKDAKFEAE